MESGNTRWTSEQENPQNVKSSLSDLSHTPNLGPMKKIFPVIIYDFIFMTHRQLPKEEAFPKYYESSENK